MLSQPQDATLSKVGTVCAIYPLFSAHVGPDPGFGVTTRCGGAERIVPLRVLAEALSAGRRMMMACPLTADLDGKLVVCVRLFRLLVFSNGVGGLSVEHERRFVGQEAGIGRLRGFGLTSRMFPVCGVDGMCWSWLCWVDELTGSSRLSDGETRWNILLRIYFCLF